METAVANGLSASGGVKLREILDLHWNTFQRGLRGDRPARVKPLTFKPEANVVKAQGRVYSPIKTTWLALCIGTLVAPRLLFYNLQAVWATTTMAEEEFALCVTTARLASKLRRYRVSC